MVVTKVQYLNYSIAYATDRITATYSWKLEYFKHNMYLPRFEKIYDIYVRQTYNLKHFIPTTRGVWEDVLFKKPKKQSMAGK